MRINGIEIDVSKLLSREELLAYLKLNGEDDRSLADIRNRYSEEFGNELMWRYPISDGLHAGTFIVVIKEGFISLPYDVMEKETYEILELDHVAMFDADSMQIFIDDWNSYSADLLGALGDMLGILSGK